ncbi:YfiR family protein [Marinilabiliaceae bacterium ANBcel2]|nr:YfiR family protein [Marinilabiliaceae bacterium ANBcel2]
MKKILFATLLIMLPLFNNSIQAQAQVDEYKAVFTLNFLRYIGWPDSSLEGDFVIGVIRNSNVANNLREQSEGKKFGFQDVVVREYSSVDEIEECQLIYVGSRINIRRESETLIEKARESNSLIISEADNATDHGAAINFVIRDNTLRFELHQGNAAWMGLQFSSRLEGMSAAIVL